MTTTRMVKRASKKSQFLEMEKNFVNKKGANLDKKIMQFDLTNPGIPIMN